MANGDADAREVAADRAMAARDLAGAERLLAELAADQPELTTWLKLAGVRRARGDLHGALAAVSHALQQDPLAFLPLLLRARLLELCGHPEAAEAFEMALVRVPADHLLSPTVAGEVAHGRAIVAANRKRRAERLHGAVARSADAATSRERERLDRFVSNVTRSTKFYPQQPTHWAYPGLPTVEFFDPLAFAEMQALEAQWSVIRDEFRTVMSAHGVVAGPYVSYPPDVPLDQWRDLNNSVDWTAIHLIRNGEVVEENARHCPRTIDAYLRLDCPEVPGRGPNLMFSLLAPKTRIPPHTGAANTRLVLHLPLIVPPGCGFRVGGQTVEWQVGKVIVFDDTIEHEAWNDSNILRTVLIGDLWRPELSQPERAGIAAAMAEGPMIPIG